MVQVSHFLWALAGHPGQYKSIFALSMPFQTRFLLMLAARLSSNAEKILHVVILLLDYPLLHASSAPYT